MKKFFTFVIAASLLLMMNEKMNAQDFQNPWHLIAFENEKEDAFYNTEMITGIEADQQNVTIVLDNGKRFTHPTATTTFGFDPRQEGTATINENIAVSLWKVNYANGRLYFNETVNEVFIHTINGSLVSHFTGKCTEASVYLSSGIYIVQADGKSAKLFVNNGSGSTSVQSDNETSVAVSTSASLINLRSDISINAYWNITAKNATLSIRISDIERFSFSADISLSLILKNEATMEFPDYQGIEFSIEPVNPENEIKSAYYQGASGYVKFHLMHFFSDSRYIHSTAYNSETVFYAGDGDGDQFYLDKIDSTRYLIKYGDKYVVPPSISGRFDNKLTVMEAIRDGDFLTMQNGTVVDLKEPNEFTYKFAHFATSGGKSYYTIYGELINDEYFTLIYGTVAAGANKGFIVDVDPSFGWLMMLAIGDFSEGNNIAAFAIEK